MPYGLNSAEFATQGNRITDNVVRPYQDITVGRSDKVRIWSFFFKYENQLNITS